MFYTKKQRKKSMKHIIIDTDVANEIDDQFAIAYALTSPEFKVEAITVCPFYVSYKPVVVEDGVVDSYFEAKRICRYAGVSSKIVYQGSTNFYSNGYREQSEAVQKIIEIAKANTKTYLVCLGTLTNLAIALDIEPRLEKKIEVVWLGTKNLLDDTFTDSNYRKDKKAFERVMHSNVKLHVIPSYVGKYNATSIYELKEHVAVNTLGKYLLKIVKNFKFLIENRGLKYIYDIMPIAYLKNNKLFKYKEIPRNMLLKEQPATSPTQTLTYVYDGSTNNAVWLDFIDTIQNAPTNVFKPKVFFTSDTHFSQKNKIRTKEFSFESIAQTDHEYIKRWNATVGKKDTVYHLGDFGDYNIIKKLNGKVILLCGNYEKRDMAGNFTAFREHLLNLGFADVIENNLVLDKNVLGIPVNLTHKPEDCNPNMFNLYGHVHSLKPLMKHGFNVCIEYHNFTPVSLEFIKDYINFIQKAQNDPNAFVE